MKGLTDLLSPSVREIRTTDVRSLRIALSTWDLVLGLAVRALDAFIGGDLRSFDAHIGNNSCYLTASIVVQAANLMAESEVVKESIIYTLGRLRQIQLDLSLLNSNIRALDASMGESVEFLLRRRGLTFETLSEIHYLVMAYASAMARRKDESHIDVIDAEALAAALQCREDCCAPRATVNKLIKHWQKQLSAYNIEFLQSQSHYLPNHLRVWGHYVTDPYIRVDPRGRLCSSSFYAMKVLMLSLSTSLSSRISLLVNMFTKQGEFVGKFATFYRSNISSNSWEIVADTEDLFRLSSCPVLVLEGCSYNDDNRDGAQATLRDRLASQDLCDIVFRHEASYPQYPKSFGGYEIVPHDLDIQEAFQSYRKNSRGYSLADPTEVCLVHLYPDTIGRQLQAHLDPPKHLPHH
jgi:hypothetical protein